MELQTTFEERRSIRRYTNEDISNETILTLLNSARIPPSAKKYSAMEILCSKGRNKRQSCRLYERVCRCTRPHQILWNV